MGALSIEGSARDNRIETLSFRGGRIGRKRGG